VNTETGTITKEVLLNAPASKVWKAITDKEQMKQWYFDITEFKPEVGFEFQFSGKGHKGEQYLHLCRISEVVQGKKLTYSWKYDKYPGSSLVTFEIFDEGDKTKLRLTHRGLETFVADNPDFAKESFNEGWTYLITKAIKEFVEK
jgi:uncharacterized protein YndB with AHSA1/START domain